MRGVPVAIPPINHGATELTKALRILQVFINVKKLVQLRYVCAS